MLETQYLYQVFTIHALVDRKCDFQAFDWLKFTLTTDLRLTTFCEIDHRYLPIFNVYVQRHKEANVFFLDLAYTFLLSICPHKLNTLSDETDDPGKLKYFLASL